MRLNDGKAVKTSFWYANEILKETDINSLGEATYQNVTDLLALRAAQKEKDEVLSGLMVTPKSRMTLTLSAGAAVSFSGSYLNDGTWGFRQAKGDVFSVINPVDATISIDAAHATLNRIDAIEVRPKVLDYDTQNRRFRDPVSSLITNQSVDTMREYGMEFHVKKGTSDRVPKSPETTSGWIKLAEVEVPATTAALSFRHIKNHTAASEWSLGNASPDSSNTYETAKLQTDRELTIDADNIDDVNGVLRNIPRDLNGYRLEVKLTSDIRLTDHYSLRTFENGTFKLSNENKKISSRRANLKIQINNCRLVLVSFSCAGVALVIGGYKPANESSMRNTVFMDRVSINMSGLSNYGLLMKKCSYIEFSGSTITNGRNLINAAVFDECPMIQNLPVYQKGSQRGPEYNLLLTKSIIQSSANMFEGTKGDINPASHSYVLLDRIHTQNSAQILTKDGYLQAGKNIVTQRSTQKLPLHPRVGEQIDVIAVAPTTIQNGKGQSMIYKDAYHTTEGESGHIRMKAGDHLSMIYKGGGFVDLDAPKKTPNPSDALPGESTSCAFSHDDRYLAFTCRVSPYLGIYKVSEDGSAFTSVKLPKIITDKVTHVGTRVAFSPDNKYMAVAYGASQYTGKITIFSVDEKNDDFKLNADVVHDGSPISDIQFTHDSKTLLSCDQNAINRYEISTGGTYSFDTPGSAATRTLAIVPDDKHVVVGFEASPYAGIYTLYSTALTTSTKTVTIASNSYARDINISPDSKYISISVYRPGGINQYISTDLYKLRIGKDVINEGISLFIGSHSGAFTPPNHISNALSTNAMYIADTRTGKAIQMRKIENNNLKKVTMPTVGVSVNGRDCSFSHNNQYFAATSSASPYLEIMTMREKTGSQFVITDFETSDANPGNRFT